MTRSLFAATLVVLGSLVAAIALSIWITWSYVLPDFGGATNFLAPGLKFPLDQVRRALAGSPDQDAHAIAAALGVSVTALEPVARDAFLAEPVLSIPLDEGTTFNLRVDEALGRRDAVVSLADGRALRIEHIEGMTPWQPETVTLWVGILIVCAAGGAALIFVPLARKLRRLEETARRLSAGDLAARAPTLGATRELALALNMMAERTDRLIKGHEELLQAVSHELRTPAARIRFQLELLEAAPDHDTRRRRVEAIDRDLAELDELVGELLSFSRLGTDAPRWPRVALPLAPHLDELALDANETSALVTCTVEHGPAVALHVEPRAFNRALRNLVSNAMRAAKSRVVLSWSEVVPGPSRALSIHVDDDGPGIAPADRERLFAPFVVGDASRNRASGGVGLGLAIVRRIVELHGGEVRIDTSPLGGARLSVTFPVAGRDALVPFTLRTGCRAPLPGRNGA